MSISRSILNMGDGYSSALSSIGNIGKAAGSYANKLQSIFKKNSYSASKIRDLYTNGFFAQDSLFSPNFFVRAFDEPTYLTFKIEFITDPNETVFRNTAYNNAGIFEHVKTSVLYSTMYDYMPEPFLEEYSVVKPSNPANLASEQQEELNKHGMGKTYSTEAYLDINLGDHGRAALLHNFKAALKDIEENFPFYFKSISGLSSLSTVDPKNGARVKNGEIKIECIEGLDLKITQLINMYRKIVWDDTYQRWVLPDMMRYFGMRIYISEIRLFHNMRKESSWGKTSINILGKKSDATYDFSNADVRNAYTLPVDKSKWWEVANNALTTGTALSNSFLGTKSVISKALNYASGTVTTAMDVISGVNDIFNDVMLCNNAINDVMPTICLECHMCEFDISNTLEHLSTQYNNSKDSKAVSPTITIKVGQVKEKQSYPLNKFLVEVENGKYGFKNPGSETVTSASVVNRRNGDMGYVGQYVSDDVLNKRYNSPDFNSRISSYNENLKHDIGDIREQWITKKRFNKKLSGELNDMNYSTEGSSKMAASASLTSALLNEATDLGRMSGISSDIIGTNSTATNPEKSTVDGMRAIGEMLNAAADKIYNGSELKSLALSDTAKARIADNLFNEYVDKLESSAEKDSTLAKVLKTYKVIKEEDIPLSVATSKKEITNFSIING